MPRIIWPEGKQFAFTVFDDTDASTVENTKPIYDLLAELGFRTTKSVWPIKGCEAPMVVGGTTCEEPAYAAWAQELQRAGFEIGWHNATFHSSRRADTLRGLERFRDLFGRYPTAMANHTICEEGIYWGEHRLSGLHRAFYNLLGRNRSKGRYRGHLPDDDFFWGDLCRQHLRYVRNFVFAGMNTLRACPFMPYHDPARPCVNFWYASSEGTRVESFNKTISESSQDELEAEGGACIMYTHFAKGFYQHGHLDSRFKELMSQLARKNGWFVPVTDLLDYLLKVRGKKIITDGERAALERRWLWHKLRVGTT